jgi:hypothetical protein
MTAMSGDSSPPLFEKLTILIIRGVKSYLNPDDEDKFGLRNTGMLQPHDVAVNPKRVY